MNFMKLMKRGFRVFSGSFLVFFLFSSLAEAGPVQVSTTGHLRVDRYEIDRAHSHIVFKTKHNSYTSWGRFTDFNGKLLLNEKDMKQSYLEIHIKAKSINTDDRKRDRHLRGPDFFNVRKYPHITFKSKKVRDLGDNKYEVEGELALHGVTKDIKMSIERFRTGIDKRKNFRTGGDARFEIKRSEFGIVYGEGSISDKVEVTVSIEAIRKK